MRIKEIRIEENLNIEEEVLSGLTRIISGTGIFDKVNYSIRGFNGLEMVKEDKTYKAASGLQGSSKTDKVLEGLFSKLGDINKISVESKAPYKLKYRGVGFTVK